MNNILTNAWQKAEEIVSKELTSDSWDDFLECLHFVEDKTNDVHSRFLVRSSTIPGLFYPNAPEGQLFDWIIETYPQLHGHLLTDIDILSLVMNRKDCPFEYWETKEILLIQNFDSCYLKRDGLGGKPTVD